MVEPVTYIVIVVMNVYGVSVFDILKSLSVMCSSSPVHHPFVCPQVKHVVFVTYLRYIGMLTAAAIVACYLLASATSVGSNFWLSEWSSDADTNSTVASSNRDIRLGVYGALGFAQGQSSRFNDSCNASTIKSCIVALCVCLSVHTLPFLHDRRTATKPGTHMWIDLGMV